MKNLISSIAVLASALHCRKTDGFSSQPGIQTLNLSFSRPSSGIRWKASRNCEEQHEACTNRQSQTVKSKKERAAAAVAIENAFLSAPTAETLDITNGFLTTNSSEPGLFYDDIAGSEKTSLQYGVAVTRTLFWFAAATIFGSALWVWGGPSMGKEFFSGYLIEQSLSVDNLFVFLLLFNYFNVPLPSQDRVLYYGFVGAIVFRAIMIGLGSVALEQFHGVLLAFAGVLVASSAKMLVEFVSRLDEEDDDLEDNRLVKLAQKGLGLFMESTDEFDGDKFITQVNGVSKATPLLICMIAVEISDIVFAVDSIPAVFGVTKDPLIVFSSNLFAMISLRSLYTILSKAATKLQYLEPAVALVLGFIGSKMVGEYFGYIIPTGTSLGVVATLLATGVGLSLWDKNKNSK